MFLNGYTVLITDSNGKCTLEGPFFVKHLAEIWVEEHPNENAEVMKLLEVTKKDK